VSLALPHGFVLKRLRTTSRWLTGQFDAVTRGIGPLTVAAH
jgi:hypothetical protein